MIGRFTTQRDCEERGRVYLDICEVQEDNTLPIIMDDIDNEYRYQEIHLDKDELKDLITFLNKKLKQMQ